MVESGMKSAWLRTSPVTFEILRHRLWSMIEEAAGSLKRVSGSPVATEINDLNVGLMDAVGNSVMIGHYSAAKATTLSAIVQDILMEYDLNPGIFEGDAFLCNDPYVGVMHQNDVAIVMPITAQGKIIAWVGAEIHQVDVGGPTPGQVQLGAQDIFGEAPLFTPIKIVDKGVLRKDIERLYLRQCRVPHVNGLDLRAKIAACNVICSTIHDLVDQHSCQTVVDLLEDIQSYACMRLQKLLARLPKGSWRHRAYVEFGEMLYPLNIAVINSGTSLVIDFRGTASQAKATINLTRSALRANVMGNIVSKLGWDAPRAVGGLSRIVDIVTEPGTIVDAKYPAGVSKSTTSTGLMISGSLSLLFSKMMVGSEEYRRNAMGGWPGAKAQEELHGIDQHGNLFAADILDGMAGGGGARTWKDGIDTGGLGNSPKGSISNVERYELTYPLLYLYRRELAGSGGAGKFRGGNGIDRAYIVHGRDCIDNIIMHCAGYEIPASSGLAGGRPSVTNQFFLLRDSDIREALHTQLPATLNELTGYPEVCGPIYRTSLNISDVYRSISNGGCGYGDPLLRSLGLVESDLAKGGITVEIAETIYGVVQHNGKVDPTASEARRHEIRQARLAAGQLGRDWVPPNEGEFVIKGAITEHLWYGTMACVDIIACSCGRPLAPAQDNFKDFVTVYRRPIQEVSSHIHSTQVRKYGIEYRDFLCPYCGVLLESEISRSEDQFIWDYQPLLYSQSPPDGEADDET